MNLLTYRQDGEIGDNMKRLYVAYGSNLNLEQMAYRCPSATIYGTGILNNWELVYRGGAVNSHATIRKKQGSFVPVLLWEISPSDERRLDIYEGYPHYYFKQNVIVNMGNIRKNAMAYIMDLQQLPGKPSATYINTIRQGYVNNDLDIEIFEKSLEINSIECK